ncbi:MAG TPA: divalent metal cation transporter [Phenylobacterium sp.]|uniref:NRAMP family divalent metal transporter n=1 Tax=Phenylobacterium sp. TaxID=1871053 RepID=UPI002B49A5A1|nr:divalent metal cation transporter [Phenylobacterium sp.]HKR88893.1 divalent metal cation transporter [Phenylobacterium sp.]
MKGRGEHLKRLIRRPKLLQRLGPGLITGAADDDPSGIATYSQAGAAFGLNMLWTVVLTYPLMTAVQSICARIGRVTGKGLASNLAEIFPRPVVLALVALLFVANTINIGADLAAMGAAAQLLAGAGERCFAVGFALLSLGLQVFVPYHRYVRFLKWMTLALFAYVGVVFAVRIDWLQVAVGTLFPKLQGRDALLTVVAVLGTTISPYLFFWESSEEVEEETANGDGPLLAHPEGAPKELSRIWWDNVVGMGVSNVIAFFIILTTAVALHAHGVTDIQSSEQAAAALKPIAGPFAFLLFSAGIVGTGLLAIPVLAGSAGYAVGELQGWKAGLEAKPGEAVGFYGVIAASVLLGLALTWSSLDPIRALFWSAVVNGVISVPIMAATMVVARRRSLMGPFVATPAQTMLGWIATLVMALAVAGMVWTM